MHERGETPPPEDTFRQSLEVALQVNQRLQERSEALREAGGSAYVRHIWANNGQALERIEVFELLGIARNTDPADALSMPYKDKLLTYRWWDSTDLETEPTEQKIKTAHYLALGHTLTVDSFKGTHANAANVIEPFVSPERCNTSSDTRELLQAIITAGETNEPRMKRLVRRFRDSLFKRYSAEEIAEYIAATEGITELPGLLRKERISEFAARRFTQDSDPKRTPRPSKPPLSTKQIDESVRLLASADLIHASLFGSKYTYRNFAVCELLHSRLHSEKATETIAYLNQNPINFISNYVETIFDTHTEDPKRQPVIARLLPGASKTSLHDVIAAANTVITLLNSQPSGRERMQLLNTTDTQNAGRAFAVLLNTTHSSDLETRLNQRHQDEVHVAVVNKLLEISRSQWAGRTVLSRNTHVAYAEVST